MEATGRVKPNAVLAKNIDRSRQREDDQEAKIIARSIAAQDTSVTNSVDTESRATKSYI